MSRHKRATNFSKSEEIKLIKLVLEKKHIFHNMKTDAISSKLKDVAWQELAQKFNASSFDEVRNAKVLREKYNNIKRCLRKKKANNRRKKVILSPREGIFEEFNDAMSVSVDNLPSKHYAEAIVHIGDQTELKEEMIDYLDEDVEQDAEAHKDCDVSCAVITDIGMRKLLDEELKTTPTKWEECHLATLGTQSCDLLQSSKTKTKEADIPDFSGLKKQILEQQLRQARLEHEQKMNHAHLEHEQRMLHFAEKHKIQIQILEADLEFKKSIIK